jgi:hypothetical protein
LRGRSFNFVSPKDGDVSVCQNSNYYQFVFV